VTVITTRFDNKDRKPKGRKLSGGPPRGFFTKIWKLDSPEHCRDFLSKAYIGDMKLEFVDLESGRRLFFKDMDDGEIVHYANRIADMIGARKAKS
jgi:hypothetical protein